MTFRVRASDGTVFTTIPETDIADAATVDQLAATSAAEHAIVNDRLDDLEAASPPTLGTIATQDADAVAITGGSVAATGKLNLGASTVLVASGFAVTITKSYHALSVVSGTRAQRKINTINGGVTGDLLLIRKSSTSPGDPVIEDAAGNIQLQGGDFTMNNVNDTILLFYNGTSWLQLGRNNNN